MNGQYNGIGGRPHGPAAESAPAGTTVPTPVTSPGTAHSTPAASGHDAGQWTRAVPGRGAPGQDAGVPAEGWAAPTAQPGVPAEGWGAPAAKPRNGSATPSWTVRRGLAVAGAAAVLAAGAGVGVYALTSSSASADVTTGASGGGPVGTGGPGSVQGGPGAQGGFGGGGVPGQGGSGTFAPDGTAAMGGLSAAVHAEYVVLQGSEYVTKAEQLGNVTEVTSGVVTVRSSDGFNRSYTLTEDVLVMRQQQRRQQAGNAASRLTVADIVPGGTVRVVSAKNGSDYAAESVIVTTTSAGGAGNTGGITGGTGNTGGTGTAG